MDYLLLTEIAAAYYLLLLYILKDLAVLETFDAVLSFPCRCRPFARCLRHPYRRSRFWWSVLVSFMLSRSTVSRSS